MNRALTTFHRRVRELGCIHCLMVDGVPDTPAAIHHTGAAHERSDWMVVPLCREHHQGANGYHGLGGEPGYRARYGFGEHQLLAWTNEGLARGLMP